MAGPNAEPIFSKASNIQWIAQITAANTNQYITTGTSYLLCTADSTNGGYLREVRIKAAPGNNTAATVARLWLNNGATTSATANSILITEIGIPATTASNTAANPDFVIPVNFALPPSYAVYLTIGTATGGASELQATAILGKY